MTDVFFMEDGWFNATLVAMKHGKDVEKWTRSDDAFRYGRALAKSLNLLNPPPTGINEMIHFIENEVNHERRRVIIPQFLKQVGLIKTRRGSVKNGGGTWFHPKLGVKFARWLSVDFELWCDERAEAFVRQAQQQQTPLPDVVRHAILPFYVVGREEDVALKGVRNNYVAVLNSLGFNASVYKRELTDCVNETLMGLRARPFRRVFGIPAGSRRRTRLFDYNLRRATSEVEEITCQRAIDERIVDWYDLLQIAVETARVVRATYASRQVLLSEHVPDSDIGAIVG